MNDDIYESPHVLFESCAEKKSKSVSDSLKFLTNKLKNESKRDKFSRSYNLSSSSLNSSPASTSNGSNSETSPSTPSFSKFHSKSLAALKSLK
jgi:hypothetical protein